MSSSTLSIIHLTLGGDNGVYGDRNPAVWLHRNGFAIRTAINGNKDTAKDIFPPLEAGKWMHFEMSQTLVKNKVKFFSSNISLV